MFNKLLALPDRLLDQVTMYRLVTYFLLGILEIAVVECWLGLLDVPLTAVLGTTAVAVSACLLANLLFAYTFNAPVNNDSAVITGLILALIVGPAQTRDDYLLLTVVAALAMASKYILAYRELHLFNPAALALVLTAEFANRSASWWVGTTDLTPFVIIGGLLLVRRIRRGDLVFSFLITTLGLTTAWSLWSGLTLSQSLHRGIIGSPVWFLGFVMLTEPITIPPTRSYRLAYGVLTGILVVPQLHFGSQYLTPEFGLVIANAIAIPIRSRQRRKLTLERALAVGPGLVDFIYSPNPPLAYQPGQYMEWTFDHPHVDARGKRRYLTLASSPTERNLRIGIKFIEGGSSYKEAMLAEAKLGTPIVATQVNGDFTLPRNLEEKLAFIAGGIGVTPYRSMVKYLVDRREKRDIVLVYANRHFDEILYQDVFEPARETIPFRPVYVLSDPSSTPPEWSGESGRINAEMLARTIPDYHDRLFYISGSAALVQGVLEALRTLGVKPGRIKTDYFSGLAS